jgi:hypothetical protein
MCHYSFAVRTQLLRRANKKERVPLFIFVENFSGVKEIHTRRLQRYGNYIGILYYIFHLFIKRR